MSTAGRKKLEPGPDHEITVEPADTEVVVRRGDQVVARSRRALLLREDGYPPVAYVPLEDVDPALLKASDTTTWCPYKGEATYRSLRFDDALLEDAVWTYEAPHEAVAAIADHVAFYPQALTIEA